MYVCSFNINPLKIYLSMKRIFLLLSLMVVYLVSSCTQSEYPYEIVKNDLLQTRIYTLENGLKVYLSVNKDRPRIQTYISVRVGGKNDPA